MHAVVWVPVAVWVVCVSAVCILSGGCGVDSVDILQLV